MTYDMVKRTLFVHLRHYANDDGLIKMNGENYQFHLRQGNLTGRKMTVWVRELDKGTLDVKERLLVYKSPEVSSESFIGDADFRLD